MSNTATEFFNPLNRGHLCAYEHFNRCGKWPDEFFPDDIKYNSADASTIHLKIAVVLSNLLLHDDCFSDIILGSSEY